MCVGHHQYYYHHLTTITATTIAATYIMRVGHEPVWQQHVAGMRVQVLVLLLRGAVHQNLEAGERGVVR